MPDTIELTLVLRQPPAAKSISERLLAGTYDASQTTEADIAATPADAEAVVQFAEQHNLRVLKTDLAARTVRVAGSIADIEQAFGIRSLATLNYKGRVDLPGPLNQIVIAVLGLDRTPIARSHSR